MTGATSSMSRSEKRKASEILAFRMRPDEAEALRAAARAQGVGPTTFARRAAFEAANLPTPVYEAKAPDPRKTEVAKLIGEINRIGSNINQLARVANSTKQPPAVKAINTLFAELRALRLDILREQS